MERLQSDLRRRGSDLSNDPSMRMAQRPGQFTSRKGGVFEYLGTSKFDSQSRDKHKKNMHNHGSNARNALADESLDEIDFLSQESRSRDSDADFTSNRKKAASSRRAKSPLADKVVVGGKALDYHPDYQPKPKLPSFKKTKKAVNDHNDQTLPTSSQESNTPSSLQNTRHATLARLSTHNNGMSYTAPDHPKPHSQAQPRASTLVGTRKSSREPQEFPLSRLSPLRRTGREQEQSKAKGKDKVAPFPVSFSPPASDDSSASPHDPLKIPLKKPLVDGAHSKGPASRARRLPESDSDDTTRTLRARNFPSPGDYSRLRPRPRKKPPAANTVKTAASRARRIRDSDDESESDDDIRNIPDDLPVDDSRDLSSEKLLEKPRRAPPSEDDDYNRRPTRARVTRKRKSPEIEVLSDIEPLANVESRHRPPADLVLQEFPALKLSPVRGSVKSAQKDTERHRGEPISTHRSSPQRCKRSKIDSFPMPSPFSSPMHATSPKAKQKLKQSKSLTSLNEDDETSVTKNDEIMTRGALRPFPMAFSRLETSGTQEDRGEGSSRQKNSCMADYLVPGPESPSTLLDDSLFLESSVDPSMLCPYCDELLPSSPTPHLRSLIAAAKRKSSPDPRPGNLFGLKAQLATFISVCQRHEFEIREIPRARARGWPSSIDFNKVKERIEGLAATLKKLVANDHDERKNSIFWRQVEREVQDMGSRAAAGFKGQFDNFEKTQPGYYGELGSMVIHQTLYNLFPFSSVDVDSIAPLTYTDFINRILVPEAALALIMEDMGQGPEEAARTMHHSAAYGVAMFPDSGDGDGKSVGTRVGENIVKERARVRRKELEEEDRVEKMMIQEQELEERAALRQKGKKRQLDHSSATATESERKATTASKTKRKKASPAVDETEGDMSSALSDVSEARRSTRAVTRAKATVTRNRKKESNVAHLDTNNDQASSTIVASLYHRKAKAKGRVSTPSEDEHVEIVPSSSQQTPKSRLRPRLVATSKSKASFSSNVDDIDDERTPKPKAKGRGPSAVPENRLAKDKKFFPLKAAQRREATTEPVGRLQREDWRFKMADPISISDDSSDDASIQARSPHRKTHRGRTPDLWLDSSS